MVYQLNFLENADDKSIRCLFTDFAMSLEKFLFFDECGDPVNGYGGKRNAPIFFIGCVHTASLDEINKIHSKICSIIQKDNLHFDNLSIKARATAWKMLVDSSLKLDIGVSITNNFNETKKIFSEIENHGGIFKLGAATYKKFDEMCQTEMFAKMTWLIFVGNSSVVGHPMYEEPVRQLANAKENPVIEYERSTRVNVDVWKKIHLDRQLVKYGLSCVPVETQSKGTELADILVSGYRDNFLSNGKKIPTIIESLFGTTGDSIWMERDI
jgi:hypothetical protein